MKLRSIAAATMAALLAGALLAPAASATGSKKVGEDDAGDWGANVDPELGPIGDLLGQDLVEARIDMSDDRKAINFIIKLNSLPPIGGVPEVSRYTWDFELDRDPVKLDGKFTNYSRGVCDPTSGQCPPPRDPGLQPFIVRGNCEVQEAGANVTICEELGIVEAEFDAAEATITIPVPMELIGAKRRSLITPSNTGLFGGTVEAMPSAFLSSNSMPSDSMIVTRNFRIPRR